MSGKGERKRAVGRGGRSLTLSGLASRGIYMRYTGVDLRSRVCLTTSNLAFNVYMCMCICTDVHESVWYAENHIIIHTYIYIYIYVEINFVSTQIEFAYIEIFARVVKEC